VGLLPPLSVAVRPLRVAHFFNHPESELDMKIDPLTNECKIGIVQLGRLYSISEHHGLVAFEFVCMLPGEEERMDKNEGGLVRLVLDWLNKDQFVLVVLLSVAHIGLAYIHTRDTGRTAHPTNPHY
jgi:hypothetical protein